MIDFYRTCMRSASVILFIGSLVIVLMAVFAAVSVLREADGMPGQFNVAQALSGIFLSMSNAALPFLGAAALFRFDAWLGRAA